MQVWVYHSCIWMAHASLHPPLYHNKFVIWSLGQYIFHEIIPCHFHSKFFLKKILCAGVVMCLFLKSITKISIFASFQFRLLVMLDPIMSIILPTFKLFSSNITRFAFVRCMTTASQIGIIATTRLFDYNFNLFLLLSYSSNRFWRAPCSSREKESSVYWLQKQEWIGQRRKNSWHNI